MGETVVKFPEGHPSLHVEDRLPVLFLPGIPVSAPGNPFARRRRPLITFPHASTLSDAEIPWVGLYQSLDLRMGRILDSLDRISRGEPLVLPRVVPVRISEKALTFFFSEPVPANSTGSVTVELPTLPVFEIESDLSVIKCDPWPSGTENSSFPGYAVTGEWVGLGGETRESLVQYLVLRQRELLAFQGRKVPDL